MLNNTFLLKFFQQTACKTKIVLFFTDSKSLPSQFSAASLTIALGLQLTVLDGLRIPGTGEPGGLPSMGSHRVGHD